MLIALFFCSVSCEKLLEVSPKTSLEARTAIRNKKELEYGINSCYDQLQSPNYYGRVLFNLGDLPTDIAFNGGTIKEYGQVNNALILEDNSLINDLWTAIYAGINRVNNMLRFTDILPDLTENERTAFRAELYFLRALMYHDLVRCFGDVPLKLEATSGLDGINTPLSPKSLVYETILADLDNAKDKIISNSSIKANNMAVYALLSRVYLELENWDKVIEATSNVINNPAFRLDSSYSAIFLNESGPEAIFQVDFDIQDKNRLAEYYFPTALTGRYEVAPDPELIAGYEPGDIRKTVTIKYAGDFPYCNKFEDISTGADNVIVFRMAEMYLNRAEAKAEKQTGVSIQEVKDDINIVRKRAGLANTSAEGFPQLLLAIENERKFEFAFEGRRWFDLIRTGRAIEVLDNINSASQYYFPVPLSEKSTNEAID